MKYKALLCLSFCLFLAQIASGQSHRYWRIYITSQNGGNNAVSINTIIMWDSSGNYLTTGGTASASSCYGGCPGTYDASKAFDTNDTTFWGSTGTPTSSSPQWIEYDFGSAKAVAYWLVGSRAGLCSQGPEAFKLQYSDDNSSWTDATGSYSPNWCNGSTYSFVTFPVSTPPAGSYTNWRINYTSSNSGNSSLGEVSMATSAGGSNVIPAFTGGSSASTTGRPWASSCYTGCTNGTSNYTSGAAFDSDGSGGTFWAATGLQKLVWSMSQAYNIFEIKLMAAPSGNNGDAPTGFNLEGSNDGTTWTNVQSFTSGSWTANQQQTFDVGSSVPVPTPNIASLSPTTGAVGASVTISGSNFGTTQGTSTVKFNGTTATATSWSATSIVVTVPSGATTGNVVVTVSGLASNGVSFTVVPAPSITSLSPTAGAAGAWVTIAGSNFGSTQGTSTVKFNGTIATPTSWNASTIVVAAPTNATTGSVLVHASGVDSNGVNFTYSTTGTITGIVTRASDGTPLSGASVQALKSGAVNGSATTAADGSYSISSLTSGVYDLSVSATGYLALVKSSNLVTAAATTTVNLILGAPTIGTLSPNSGPAGLVITVSGSYFGGTQGTSTLTFNGVAAAPTNWSNTNIVVPVPTGATTGPVVITVAGVASNGMTFTVGTGTITGTITRVSDGSAISGATVAALQSNVSIASTSTGTNGTYTLSNLTPGTYDVRVSASGFGTSLQANTSVTANGSTTVNASLPSPGTVAGTVTKSDGITAIAGANVSVIQSADTVSSATTNSTGAYSISNLSAGTYSVQVSASGYTPQTRAGISITTGNTTTANFSLAGQSVITYVYDALGRLTGAVDSQSNAATYSYDAVGNLLSISNNPSTQISIIGFAPLSGPVGTSITISGTAFSTTPSQNTVKFNGTSATVTAATATQLTATVPAGATTGAVSVTAPSGSATSTTSFTVTASAGVPTITSFTPVIGVPGTAVTITGTNFDVAANDKTRFNVALANASSATATTISTSVPSGATSGHISVTTPIGKVVSAADFFAPPVGYTTGSVGFTGRMSLGGTSTVTLSTAGQIGLMVFDGTSGQRVSLNLTNGTFPYLGLAVYLLTPVGATLSSATGLSTGGYVGPQTLPTTGTYTILFVAGASATGSISVSPNSVVDISGTITPNGSGVGVNITTPGQVARLTFSGTSGQRMSVNCTNGTIPYPGPTLSLLNPDGSTLASVSGVNPFLTPQTLPTTGTYTILLAPSGAGTGSITINLYIVVDISGTITPNGSGVAVNITAPGQVARLTFSGTSGQQVSVNLTSGTFPYPGATVSLLKPDGTTLASVAVTTSGQISSQTLPTTGTYTILVAPSGALTGSITVTLTSP